MKRKMDLFGAHRLSSTLSVAGFAAVMIGCLLGERGLGGAVALAVGGVLVLACGFAVGYRYLTCPHCSEPLYHFPRLPSQVPRYCPHCGKEIKKTDF